MAVRLSPGFTAYVTTWAAGGCRPVAGTGAGWGAGAPWNPQVHPDDDQVGVGDVVRPGDVLRRGQVLAGQREEVLARRHDVADVRETPGGEGRNHQQSCRSLPPVPGPRPGRGRGWA